MLFKKTKKITPYTTFMKYLEEQVDKRPFPINNEEEKRWAREYAENQSLRLDVSHMTDDVVYYTLKS